MSDNKEYTQYDYALTQAHTEPDIYFDEIEELNSLSAVRLIFAQFLEASNGSLLNLQVLMCLFAGLSLRETSKITKTSHENCRTILNTIKNTYPELHQVIKDQNGTVQVIVPNLLDKRYKVVDTMTNKESYFFSPMHISRKLKITSSTICMHIQRNQKSPIKKRWYIYKLDKGE